MARAWRLKIVILLLAELDSIANKTVGISWNTIVSGTGSPVLWSERLKLYVNFDSEYKFESKK